MAKICIVPSCRNDSFINPETVFFSLPKDPSAKREWLEALGLKFREGIQNIKVCDVHFRPKDFCAGRKQLKGHAVPALNLGIKTEPLTEDEMHCDSDYEDDVLDEVKRFGSIPNDMMEIKTEEKIEQEPETGRRPSRRAAREAAKKIYNTVRNYGTVPDPSDPDILEGYASLKSAVHSPRSVTQQQRKRAYQSIRVPPPNIDLLLECHEELLSTVQAEALLQAQLQYNMVMKTLRNLKASNVRIVVAPADPLPSESSNDGVSNPSQPEEAQEPDSQQEVLPEKTDHEDSDSEKINTEIPMELSMAAPSPAPILS